jgi:formamidopyrimidine-DNA glycosylase
MGPEPLTLSVADFIPALKKTKRPIKNALMDQRVIAGLGNIYVDESLHAAGIHPLALSHRLKPEQVTKLLESIQHILNRAIRARGSTLRDYVDATGRPGEAHLLHVVYDRAGHPCRNCETPIKRIVLGGRSTHFCPQCQPRRAK